MRIWSHRKLPINLQLVHNHRLDELVRLIFIIYTLSYLIEVILVRQPYVLIRQLSLA